MNWYVQIGDEQRGPIGSDELKQLASVGIVDESTPIRQGLDGKWSTAGKVKGLQFQVAVPPLAPPMKATSITRKCPFCAEEINLEAIKCKHCGEFLNGASKASQSVQDTNGHVDMPKLAESQRTLILVLLLAFLLQGPVLLMAYGEPALGLLTQFVLIVLQAIATFRISKHCYGDSGMALILTFLALIPFFGILALLVVNGKATKVLQSQGFKVGLLGVDKAAISDMRQVL